MNGPPIDRFKLQELTEQWESTGEINEADITWLIKRANELETISQKRKHKLHHLESKIAKLEQQLGARA